MEFKQMLLDAKKKFKRKIYLKKVKSTNAMETKDILFWIHIHFM
jgi:hypothetical protein